MNKFDSTKKQGITGILVILIIIIGFFLNNGTESGFSGNENNQITNSYDISTYNSEDSSDTSSKELQYTFRNEAYLSEHFEKHKSDFDYTTKEEYEEGANRVITSDAALHKIEQEDGDDVFYIEETNEFVILSTDGFIRTYFRPNDGIQYFNRQ